MTNANTRGGNQTVDRPESEAIAIDFMYWEDCPSYERALQVLHEVIDQEQVTAQVRIQQVETSEQAEEYAFPGSPTIRVQGRDIDDNPSLPVGLACRAYRRTDGRITPLPPREKIVTSIQEAARRMRATEQAAS